MHLICGGVGSIYEYIFPEHLLCDLHAAVPRQTTPLSME